MRYDYGQPTRAHCHECGEIIDLHDYPDPDPSCRICEAWVCYHCQRWHKEKHDALEVEQRETAYEESEVTKGQAAMVQGGQ